MPQYPHLSPAPFAFAGGDVGVLLLHGLTGAPTEMRGLGEHLHRQGFTVRAPLLPGHGTHHVDLENVTKTQWVDAAREQLLQLRATSSKVFVVGQSMGGLLALVLGAERRECVAVDGIIALAPALVISRLAWFTRFEALLPRFFPKREERRPDLVDGAQIKEMWSYTHTPRKTVRELLRLQNDVRSLLPHISAPLLLLQGRQDRLVSASAAPQIIAKVASIDKELIGLENTGHMVSVDSERQEVFIRCAAFIRGRCQGPAPKSVGSVPANR